MLPLPPLPHVHRFAYTSFDRHPPATHPSPTTQFNLLLLPVLSYLHSQPTPFQPAYPVVPAQRPRRAQYEELLSFHSEEYIDVLRHTTPEQQAQDWNSYLKWVCFLLNVTWAGIWLLPC